MDRVDTQKMFIDNINQHESNYLKITRIISASVGSVAELRTIDTTDTGLYTDGMVILVRGIGTFYFDSTSSAGDDGIGVIKPNVGNGRWLSVVRGDIFQLASGTAVDITLNGVSLVDGYSVTFRAAYTDTSTNKTINGKPWRKLGTTLSPSTVAGRAYTVWYDVSNTCFFYKASASGNAVAENVLAGKTFSNDNDTDILGTMTNQGAVNQSLPINGSYTIPAGYHNGTGRVTQSIPSKNAATYTPGTTNQIIAAGQYLAESQLIVGDADLISGNIRYGVSLFGVAGDPNVIATNTSMGAFADQVLTGRACFVNGQVVMGAMPNNGNKYTPASMVNGWDTVGRLYVLPPHGYYDGVYSVICDDSNFIKPNIVEGKSIFGLVGTAKVVTECAQISNLALIVPVSGGMLYATWSNPSDGKIKGVRIMVKAGSYPTSSSDGTAFYDSNDGAIATSASCSGLTDGTRYYVRAFAYTYQNATRLYTTTTTGAQANAVPLKTQGSQTFTSSGTFTVPTSVYSVQAFVVGGGGGGGGGYVWYDGYAGGNYCGGGGGGGYTGYGTYAVTPGQQIAITVGAGGTAGPGGNGGNGGAGGASSFGSFLSKAGGNGGTTGSSGGSGGSGGGAGYYSTGNPGGQTGGQSGTAGGSDGSSGGTGGGNGQGSTTRAFGESSNTLYSGGGGGGTNNNTRLAGGAGGGGNGGCGASGGGTGLAGSANTGSGGGGAYDSEGLDGGAGGSGIVIVRWGY
jgi:hypothetical protein